MCISFSLTKTNLLRFHNYHNQINKQSNI
ncbi:unnamed protein product [Linum tenue]|uniref:Uncharacterized protein n=1 Tax=Linum tenue TaxID=586396 RepID=A0AAV0NSU8_9ROSI|nr:unnamed protein product [Linum tenue]